MKRAVAVVAVAALLVMAGCVGGSLTGPDETPQEPPVAVEDSDTPTENGSATGPGGELEIHHIDVGQADSTLIVTPANETILIDTGHWQNDGDRVISYLESQDITRIDHLVATHAHSDHIGGHAAVLDHFETHRNGVGNVYDSGVPHTTQTYEDYLDAVERHEKRIHVVEEGDTLPVNDTSVAVTVLNPAANRSETDIQEDSITLLVDYGEFRYLLTGDLEAAGERRIVDAHGDRLDADVYHAGHHGSSTSSTDALLSTADPQIAVISSAYDSPYGHPHDETLHAFDTHGITTYWTGVHGDVVVSTDGEAITVEPTADAPTDPNKLLEEKHSDTIDKVTTVVEAAIPATVPVPP